MNAQSALKNLTPYERPTSYAGKTYEGYYVVYGKNRDSHLIDEHNFAEIEKLIRQWNEENIKNGGEDVLENGMVEISRQSHWACGWVEFIYVRMDAPEDLLVELDDALYQIKQYPILDENAYSDLVCERICEYWDSASQWERRSWIDNALEECGRDGEAVRDWLWEEIKELIES